jgi:hypothetical protein
VQAEEEMLLTGQKGSKGEVAAAAAAVPTAAGTPKEGPKALQRVNGATDGSGLSFGMMQVGAGVG